MPSDVVMWSILSVWKRVTFAKASELAVMRMAVNPAAARQNNLAVLFTLCPPSSVCLGFVNLRSETYKWYFFVFSTHARRIRLHFYFVGWIPKVLFLRLSI